jgi:parvulin-like peptidyl-prolyl isomerase
VSTGQRRRLSVLLVWLALGCAERGAREQASTLPPEALARVGPELVSATTVSRIALAQTVTPQVALTRAVTDATFARAARAELSVAVVRSVERAAAARAVLEELPAEVERAGPPTPAEVEKIVLERWTDLRRPDAVRTAHAVVINDKPAKDGAARAVAAKLALALAQTKSQAELIAVASAFPGEGFEIRAEELPFVTADGRVMERRDGGFVALPGAFDVDFARGANALREPGQLSGLVKSAFGYHVIRLEELAPGVVVTGPELSALVDDEVYQRRAKRSRRELLERLRAATAIRLERAVDDLTTQVKVAP